MLIVENILDVLEDYGEEGTQKVLASFMSPKNPEIEAFLKNNAVSLCAEEDVSNISCERL